MNLNKKIVLIILILSVFALFLSGCIEGHMHVSFNIDGSADIEFMLLASTAMGMLEGQGMDIFADIKSDMINDGFTLEDKKTEDKKGFVGRRKIDNLDELYELTFLGDMEPPDVEITEGLFIDEYVISHNMKLSIPGMGAEDDAFAKLLDPKISFILTFPIDPVTHNADRVSSDGKTIEWDIGMESEKPVNVVVNVPKIDRIILVVAAFIILLVIVIFIVKAIKKKK